MKKWLTLILVVLMVSLTACSSKNDNDAKGSNGEGKAETKTIRILAHWEGANVEAYKKLIAEYEDANPGVKVQLETVPFGDLMKKITSSKLSKDGPDIYHIYSGWLPDLVKSNTIVPAPDAFKSDIEASYSSNISDSASIDGKVYGYPTELTAYALNYNKRLFEEAGIKEPPKTWAELEDYAKRLSKVENGKVVQQGFGIITSWDSGVVHPFLALLQSNGGSLLNGDNTAAAFNSKEGQETIDLYKRLIDAKALNPEMSTANASTTGPYMNNFELEKTAMIIMANWWQGGLKSTMGDKYNNIATAPIPVGPSGSQSSSVFYSWLYSVNADSKNQEAAWDFLKWINSPVADGKSSRQGDWLLSQGILPSRTSDQEASKGALANDQFLKTYVEALANAKSYPIVNGAGEITVALQKQVEAVVFGQAKAADALKAAEAQVNGVLKK